MSDEIKAPQFPESVADGTVATWHKKVGEPVARDELLVDIETDKIVLEVVAPSDGVLEKIFKDEGEVIEGEAVLAIFKAGELSASAETSLKENDTSESKGEDEKSEGDAALSPAVRKLIRENELNPEDISGSGKGGRLLKEDVLAFIKDKDRCSTSGDASQSAESSEHQARRKSDEAPAPGGIVLPDEDRVEKRVPMTRLRARIAERLVQAQQEAAMLTTFNEVNMKPIMDMRKNYKEQFQEIHGVKLGFMSFFVRAATEALKRYPAMNASIDGSDVVYHSYFDIGVAVSTDRGLVVPVLKDADKKGLGEIESQIIDYGKKAQDGKLSLDDMTGGTFTISNGGTFGSLLSTPIVNPPQTGILGMHTIQERPMAVNGEVVILPMMYLAITYDHRLIDGKTAVQFLIAMKSFIEDPARLLLEI